MAKGNGGVIGPYNASAPGATSGVWSLGEHLARKAEGEWDNIKASDASTFQAFVLGGGGGGGGGNTNYYGSGGGRFPRRGKR